MRLRSLSLLIIVVTGTTLFLTPHAFSKKNNEAAKTKSSKEIAKKKARSKKAVSAPKKKTPNQNTNSQASTSAKKIEPAAKDARPLPRLLKKYVRPRTDILDELKNGNVALADGMTIGVPEVCKNLSLAECSCEYFGKEPNCGIEKEMIRLPKSSELKILKLTSEPKGDPLVLINAQYKALCDPTPKKSGFPFLSKTSSETPTAIANGLDLCDRSKDLWVHYSDLTLKNKSKLPNEVKEPFCEANMKASLLSEIDRNRQNIKMDVPAETREFLRQLVGKCLMTPDDLHKELFKRRQKGTLDGVNSFDEYFLPKLKAELSKHTKLMSKLKMNGAPLSKQLNDVISIIAAARTMHREAVGCQYNNTTYSKYRIEKDPKIKQIYRENIYTPGHFEIVGRSMADRSVFIENARGTDKNPKLYEQFIRTEPDASKLPPLQQAISRPGAYSNFNIIWKKNQKTGELELDRGLVTTMCMPVEENEKLSPGGKSALENAAIEETLDLAMEINFDPVGYQKKYPIRSKKQVKDGDTDSPSNPLTEYVPFYTHNVAYKETSHPDRGFHEITDLIGGINGYVMNSSPKCPPHFWAVKDAVQVPRSRLPQTEEQKKKAKPKKANSSISE